MAAPIHATRPAAPHLASGPKANDESAGKPAESLLGEAQAFSKQMCGFYHTWEREYSAKEDWVNRGRLPQETEQTISQERFKFLNDLGVEKRNIYLRDYARTANDLYKKMLGEVDPPIDQRQVDFLAPDSLRAETGLLYMPLTEMKQICTNFSDTVLALDDKLRNEKKE